MEFRAAAQLASMSDADAEPQFPSMLAAPPPVAVEDSELPHERRAVLGAGGLAARGDLAVGE